MKRLFMAFILGGMLLSFTGCNRKDLTNETGNKNEGNVTNQKATGNDLIALSEELAVLMAEGEFGSTAQKFSATVKAKMNEASLKQAWNATVDGLGDFIEIYDTTEESDKKYQFVYVVLRYENNGLKVKFTYNKSEQIDGLWLSYSSIDTVGIPETLEEVAVTIGKEPYVVDGMLTLPLGVEKPPVVILVPGSGTHDMDETIGSSYNKPFRDIAWGLAEQGIASIRYNERFYHYPDKAPANFTIYDDCLDDVSEAITYAINSTLVDKSRLYVLGHSLGGMMAPKIAYDHKEVKGIISLAGSPRKLEDISYDQNMDYLETTQDYSDAQKEELIAMISQSVENIKKLKESDTEPILGVPASYWYSLNQINTQELVLALNIPIFIVQGSKDFQVSVEKDYAAWQELLSEKENVTFRLYDNLNHIFMTTNGKSDITEYNRKGTVDQQVIEDLAQWINQ